MHFLAKILTVTSRRFAGSVAIVLSLCVLLAGGLFSARGAGRRSLRPRWRRSSPRRPRPPRPDHDGPAGDEERPDRHRGGSGVGGDGRQCGAERDGEEPGHGGHAGGDDPRCGVRGGRRDRVVRHQDDVTGGGCVGDADRQRWRERHQLLGGKGGEPRAQRHGQLDQPHRGNRHDQQHDVAHDHQHEPSAGHDCSGDHDDDSSGDHDDDSSDDYDDSSFCSGGSSAGVGVVGDCGDEQHVGQHGGGYHLRHAAVAFV